MSNRCPICKTAEVVNPGRNVICTACMYDDDAILYCIEELIPFDIFVPDNGRLLRLTARLGNMEPLMPGRHIMYQSTYTENIIFLGLVRKDQNPHSDEIRVTRINRRLESCVATIIDNVNIENILCHLH